MIYVMNLYDLKEGKEPVYRSYLKQAMALMADLEVDVVASGWRPSRTLCGNQRSHFIVVSYGSEEVFDIAMERARQADIHKLREDATSNYIWTLFEPWDLADWMGR